MRLYEYAPTRSIRVRWILQELGIDFESVTVSFSLSSILKLPALWTSSLKPPLEICYFKTKIIFQYT